jgi:hypothetical protein
MKSTKIYVAYFRYSLGSCFENRVKLEERTNEKESEEGKKK